MFYPTNWRSEWGTAGAAPLTIPTMIDETQLDWFRREHLNPKSLLAHVQPGRIAAFTIPVGGGKSTAANSTILSPETYQTFDMVVYLAPTWNIINQLEAVRNPASLPVPAKILHRRPKKRCGSLDNKWCWFEQRGCTAFAKTTLCRTCPNNTSADPCSWVRRYTEEDWKTIRLVIATEQHLNINRGLVNWLKNLAGANRALIICDEAVFLGSSFEIVLGGLQLGQLQTAIEQTLAVPEALRQTWCWSLETLMRADDAGLALSGWHFPPVINRWASAIQEVGIRKFGDGFDYLGYNVALFPGSRHDERWRDSYGGVRFTARPHLSDSTMILSAHMRPDYLADRLKIDRKELIVAPFNSVRMRHTGTTIYAIKNRIGMKSYFRNNAKQILDFFALLVARNIRQNRTTVLVSCKELKSFCANELTKRLQKLGHQVIFPTGDYDELAQPSPTVVPIIHYGMVGINDFEHYDAAYCLNSFYMPDDVLNRSFTGHEPNWSKVQIHAEIDLDSNRRVVVDDPAYRLAGLEGIADAHLRKLEVDPAIQAIGRVRPFTRPREIIFFILHDLEPDIGPVTEFRTLQEARTALELPKLDDVHRAVTAARLHRLANSGKSISEAAKVVGIPKETARRWLRHKTPLINSLMAFCAEGIAG